MSCSLSTSDLIYDPCPIFQRLVKHPAADLWGMPCPSTSSWEKTTCFSNCFSSFLSKLLILLKCFFLPMPFTNWMSTRPSNPYLMTYPSYSFMSKWVCMSNWSNCKMVSKCHQAPPNTTNTSRSSSSKLLSVVRALLSLVRRSSMASSNLYSNMQLAPPSFGREALWHCLGTSSPGFTRLPRSLQIV